MTGSPATAHHGLAALLALAFAAPQLYFAWRMCYRLRANRSATGFVGLPFKLLSLKHFTGRIISVDGHTEVTTTTYQDQYGDYAGSAVTSHHVQTYVLQTRGGQKQFQVKDYARVGLLGQVVSYWYITRMGRWTTVAVLNHSPGAENSFTSRHDLFTVLQPSQIFGMLYVLVGLVLVLITSALGNDFILAWLYALSMPVWFFGQMRARRYFRKHGKDAMWRVGREEAPAFMSSSQDGLSNRAA